MSEDSQTRIDREGDAPASILTPRQREFLHGRRPDITDRSARALRSRIRQRVKHGMLDLQLIQSLGPEIREDAFGDCRPEDIIGAAGALDGEVERGVSDLADDLEDIAEALRHA